MKNIQLSNVLILIVLFASGIHAQTIEADDPVQMTFYSGGNTGEASAATNGSEWGVVYVRFDGSQSTHFLRCTTDGIFLGGHQLFYDPNEIERYSFPNLTAYKYGWALTYEYLALRGTDDFKFKHYFTTLDKNGRKTGATALLSENIARIIPAPIWIDPVFIVFYSKELSNGFAGVHMAVLDRQAKRVQPDIVVTKPLGRNHYVEVAVPTTEGIALFGRTYINHNLDTTFYLLIGLDGKPVKDVIYLDNNGEDFFAHNAIWNGNELAVAGIEEFVDFSKATPFSRLLTTNGTWKGAQIRHTENNANRHFGIAWDGTRYVSVATNFYNGTTTARQANSNMQQAGQSITLDDSRGTDTFSKVVSNGSDAALFLCAVKVNTVANSYNVFYQRIRFPHTGKPEVKYFNGKVHEFNGTQYVLFNWVVAGAESITMKTKGGRWKLPATGFHAVEVTKKAKFKIVASNNAGNAKAKLKITP